MSSAEPEVPQLPEGVVLALDWGLRRVGLAVSDSSRSMAFPLKILQRSGDQAERAALKKIIAEHGAKCLLVGWPMHASGAAGQNASAILEWVREVCIPMDLPVFFADERYSTVMAEEYLRETGRKASRRKAMIDSMAAREFLLEVMTGAARVWPFGKSPLDHGLTDRSRGQ